MKKLKFYLLLVATYFSRFRRQFLGRYHPTIPGLVIIILLILGFILGRLIYQYTTYNMVVEGIVGEYTTTNLPSPVTNLISQPLVILDSTGLPHPNLAKSWEVNDNATVYTFTLADNLSWDDNTPLKSSDLVFNLQDGQVTYPDDKTIVFTFKDSYSPLPIQLTAPIFKNKTLVGIGKYRVEEAEYDRSGVQILKLILKPNIPNYPDIVVRFYQDETTAKTGFWLGEIQALYGVTELEDMTTTSRIFVKQIPNYSKLVAIFYNTKDPILSDKNFRKALGFATPKIANEEYAKTSIPAFSWAYNSQARDYLDHPDQAKEYLNKVKNGKDSTITLTVTPQLVNAGQKVINSWKAIGVNAVLRVESGIPQNFQAVLLTQPIKNDPDQYFLWHSTQTRTNISSYKSDRVDFDLEEGRKTTDIEVRKERYIDMQKVLADDEPATFLYFPRLNVVYLKRIEGSLDKILTLQSAF